MMAGEYTFNSSDKQIVKLTTPDRSVIEQGSFSVNDINEIAAKKGIVRYFVKQGSKVLEPKDFTITSGEITLYEKNEAK